AVLAVMRPRARALRFRKERRRGRLDRLEVLLIWERLLEVATRTVDRRPRQAPASTVLAEEAPEVAPVRRERPRHVDTEGAPDGASGEVAAGFDLVAVLTLRELPIEQVLER